MTQTTISNTPVNKIHDQILKLCHKMELQLHFNRYGPKIFTNYQRVGLIVLYYRSKKALRDFIAELQESRWPSWLGLREIPGKSTLHDWMKLFNLSTIRELNHLLLGDHQPRLVAIDATGIDSWQRNRHYERKIGSPYLPYAKLDAIVDIDRKLFLDFTFRLKPRHDVLGARSMFKRAKLRGTLVLGDGGYDCEELHEIAHEKGFELFAPVRKSSRKRPRGRFRRKCVERHWQYGQRNIIESTFHALKKTRVSALKSKKNFMKKREMGWNIFVYNLKRISNKVVYVLSRWLSLFRTRPVR